MPLSMLLVQTLPARWKCQCHPKASWGYYAVYEGCAISDLMYADPATTTYGESHPSLASLEAAHVGVRCVGQLVPAEEEQS